MTRLERRLALGVWRAALPARPGFEDRDLEAALDLIPACFPRAGVLAFRGAVLAAALLRPTFGAGRRSWFAALAKHRLAALRRLALLLKGTLFLAALERPEARRALGVES